LLFNAVICKKIYIPSPSQCFDQSTSEKEKKAAGMEN